MVDGDVIASREKVGLVRKIFGDGGWPDEDETVDAIRARLAPA